MAQGPVTSPEIRAAAERRSKRRAAIELAVAYALILSVIWSPRPLQRVLWLVAVAGVAIMMSRSWDGRLAIGLRRENFLRSLWVPATALALSATAVIVAARLHSLHLPASLAAGPGSPDNLLVHTLLFVRTFWGYALWTFV